MLNNILNKRNYNRSNIIKKYLHTLIIGTGIIFNSNNSVYATANIEEAKDVTGGIITIDSEKITYKYDGIEEEKEIKSWNEETQQMDQSIKLSQETLQALFGESKTGNLRFDYFVSNKRITETEDLNALVNKNVFLTGANTGIEFNETVNFINQQIHLFAMIGINSMACKFLFGSSNLNTKIINAKNILIAGNRVYAYLFFNSYNSTLTLNGKDISIESNKATSIENLIFLVSNNGTTTIGSETRSTLNIKENEINGKRDASLFHNYHESTLTLNGNKIAITNNTISPTFYSNGKNKDKYSVVFFNRGGIININLNRGDNPSFELLDNNMAENGKGIIGIAMINDSQLNFINNHDNNITPTSLFKFS